MCWPICFSRAVSTPSLLMKWSTSFDSLATATTGPPFFLMSAMVILSVPGHVGAADSVLGASERHHCECRCFHRQSREVFGLQRVDVGLATGARHHLAFHRQGMKKVVNPLRCLVRVEALAQYRILGGHPDRTAPRMAVIAVASRDADFALVVRFGYCFVAI